LRESRQIIIRIIALLLIPSCHFLAFSRGAWVNLIMSMTIFVTLTYALTTSHILRIRIIVFSISGLLLAVFLLALLLSIPSVSTLFFERFALVQYYDAGETGRFGIQMRSISTLITNPLGLGPFNFSKQFGNDPHNTFINAFSAYGWIGGIGYISLIVSTLIISIRTALTYSPWQNPSIAVFSVLLSTILQGIQIDTDHWRHFYWMVGINWGLFAGLHISHGLRTH
jgi:hypothetical protein